jgi:mannose-6-phosphate isomerase-like protein (cupin superfamily)
MIKKLDTIPSIKTAHGSGLKNVFVEKQDVLSNLTQAAIGTITNLDFIEPHKHPTMEEYYFILDGEVTFTINDEICDCKKNTFVLVPNNIMHSLKTNDFVIFLYWGVSI